jgi:hypothetical protein
MTTAMKPKRAYKPGAQDACYTPAYALGPLLRFVPPGATIWEAACGSGNLDGALRRRGHPVIASDLASGVDFLTSEPPACDLLITNPPYSLKFAWLRRCYAIGKPFALLVPVEMIGAAQAQALFRQHGMELLLLDKRVNFEMPRAADKPSGWQSSAQFPVLWLCWRLLPSPVCYGRIDREVSL